VKYSFEVLVFATECVMSDVSCLSQRVWEEGEKEEKEELSEEAKKAEEVSILVTGTGVSASW
jgi:hypothetical protein